jgi:ribosome-interacting GTPase 1
MMKFGDIQIQLVDTPPVGDKHVRTLLANSLRGADLIAIVVDLGTEPTGQVEATLQALREARIELLNDNLEEGIQGRYQKKMLIIGNKNDLEGSSSNWERLVSQYGGLVPMVSTSATEGNGLDRMRESVYEALDIVRVYTKAPGSKADLTEPVILKRGSTAIDAAESVHKDFQQNLRYIVIWGSGKYDGQRVGRDHALQDGDIVEFHV